MSERILEALMQLFALVAKIDGVNDNSKSVVENFLKQQLNAELVDKYDSSKRSTEYWEILQKQVE